jgi:hypothetical protein
MKRTLLATLIAAAVAPAAFAFTGAPQLLTPIDKAAIRAIVPSADLTDLTPDQAAALATALYSSDRSSEVGQQVRAILN